MSVILTELLRGNLSDRLLHTWECKETSTWETRTGARKKRLKDANGSKENKEKRCRKGKSNIPDCFGICGLRRMADWVVSAKAIEIVRGKAYL